MAWKVRHVKNGKRFPKTFHYLCSKRNKIVPQACERTITVLVKDFKAAGVVREVRSQHNQQSYLSKNGKQWLEIHQLNSVVPRAAVTVTEPTAHTINCNPLYEILGITNTFFSIPQSPEDQQQFEITCKGSRYSLQGA